VRCNFTFGIDKKTIWPMVSFRNKHESVDWNWLISFPCRHFEIVWNQLSYYNKQRSDMWEDINSACSHVDESVKKVILEGYLFSKQIWF